MIPNFDHSATSLFPEGGSEKGDRSPDNLRGCTLWRRHEVFIERKALRDLLHSVFDGRLHNQMGNQLHQIDYERQQDPMGFIERLKISSTEWGWA